MKINFPRQELHRKLYLLGLALVVCCLPLSRYVLSIAQFLLALNWFIEGRFREKFRRAFQNPSIIFFASVFVLYAIGLLYTENFGIGAAKIKNALPFLLFPIIIGTSHPLTIRNTKWLLLLFSVAVMMASFICLFNYYINGTPSDGDFRKISIFMSHIRFSLMIVMAIFILLYLSLYRYYISTNSEKIIYFISACFLIAFLFFLRSFTGIIIFIMLVMAFMINIAINSHRSYIRWALLFVSAGSFCTFTAVTVITYAKNFHAAPVRLSTLESFTVNGNRYSHDLQTGTLENGNYIDLYVCEPELKIEWNKISRIPYDSADMKGQPINGTIKRYLTSMGLRKDSAALSSLNNANIHSIENGLANYKFHENPGVYQRIYETLWEIHILIRTGYVKQHSLGQRLAFLKIACYLFSDNRWTGVGTGDVYDSMLTISKSNMLAVDSLWEGKPHNQYAFFILAFGIFGFIWIAWCWIFPVTSSGAYRFLLFNLFAGIMLISMLSLDTLESYDNMVFFTFFYCLFVFGVSFEEGAIT
jgi:hypothetical protein